MEPDISAPSPIGNPSPAGDCLPAGPIDTAAALALFDRLAVVDTTQLLGAWRGSSLASGHPFDGLLENCHWHGKRFESDEHVHPLVFRRRNGDLISLEPRLLTPGLNWLLSQPFLAKPLGNPLVGRLFQLLMPLLATRHSRARLRITRHRGLDSAAMIYDHAPIVDCFRRLDANTLLGVMDLKGMQQPFFFLLRREGGDNT
jgi:hypothetical protein